MLRLMSIPLVMSFIGLSARTSRHTPDGPMLRGSPATAVSASKARTSPAISNATRSPAVGRLSQLGIRLRYWLSVAEIRLVRRRSTLPLSFEQQAAYVALLDASWFDGTWYLDANPDVATALIDPLHHLVKHGLLEGRPPCRGSALVKPDEAVADPPANPLEAYRRSVERSLPRPSLAVTTDKTALDKGHLKAFSERIVRRGLTRFARFPLYNDDDYFALNEPLRRAPDLSGYRHALTYGFSEGRQIFSRQTVANELGLRSRAVASVAEAGVPTAVGRMSISVVYNAAGNSFLRDIADCLVYDLTEAGHDAELLDETSDPSVARPHTLIVGPHEFFFLAGGRSWLREDVLSRSLLYNTEQPQTIWFDRAVPFNMLARGVVDLAPQLASIYSECMPALFCNPSGAPLEDRLPQVEDPLFRALPAPARRVGSRISSLASRSIDVSFFGGISPHRERFFSKSARFFADYQTFIYCRRNETPLRDEGGVDLLEAARHVGFHSKLVLNIHRDEFGFFEWHRIVRLGIEAGAVVVSEPCLPHPELKPNVHYFEESGRHIQNLVEWLLRSADGQAACEAVRANAFRYVEAQRASAACGQRIARFMVDTLREGS